MLRILRLGVAAALLFAGRQSPGAGYYFETAPFVSGVWGYNTYRIPAIVRSTNGTLLAFCEGRKNSGSDSGDIDIVLRRSTNNGLAWLPQTVVQEEGGTANITIGNPSPIVDEVTGRIDLLFCRNNARVFHTASSDDGMTWSPRVEITSNVKLSTWGWYATGPGHGIQLKKGSKAGRLIVACDHNTTNGIAGIHTIYSDDHGATWALGGVADTESGVNPNETACIEVAALGTNSRVYYNTRDQGGSAAGTRGEAWSNDGGQSFAGAVTNRAAFVCPVVQGSLARMSGIGNGDATNRILFACPNNASSRVNMSVWSSWSEGVTWSEPRTIYNGPSAYSDMTQVSSGLMALLCERGSTSPYESIVLTVFDQAWLDSGMVSPENPLPAFWNFEEKAAGQSASTNAGAIGDVDPAELASHLTAQSAFSYVAGDANYGGGSALAFNGTGGLQLADTVSGNRFDYGATNSFTLEAVFRLPAGSTQTGALVAKDYGALLPSWWWRVENGRLRFLVCDGQVEVIATAVAPLVNDGAWHHAAAVRDAVNPAKVLRLYLDGVLITNVVDTTTQSSANDQPLNIGRFGNSSSRNLNGDIDLVRITPRALVPGEFVKHWTQFDADADFIPDDFERSAYGTVQLIGPGDANDNGVADVTDYAFGGDPLAVGTRPQLTVVPGSTNATLQLRQRVLPPWLAIRLECSVDLRAWTECGSEPALMPLGDGTFARMQTVSYPPESHDCIFYRARLLSLP